MIGQETQPGGSALRFAPALTVDPDPNPMSHAHTIFGVDLERANSDGNGECPVVERPRR
jgi:hypothetical protein